MSDKDPKDPVVVNDDPFAYGGDQDPAEYYSTEVELSGPVEQSIDVIFAIGIGPEFCRGNMIKYAMRAGRKKERDNALQDLNKVRAYAQFWLNFIERGHPRKQREEDNLND